MMAGKDNSFISELDTGAWRLMLFKYSYVIKQKAARMTKKSNGDELIVWDEWFQNTLPVDIMTREKNHITHDEIVKLMKWKLRRGKFRPRLIELAGSNSPSEVEKLSLEAFALMSSSGSSTKTSKIEKAINLLSKLKGIGPATASAILTAGFPETVAFMADEPTYMILGEDAKLKYSLGEYMTYHKCLVDISDQLNMKDPAVGWTPHKVELALWTHCMVKKLDIKLPDVGDETSKNTDSCGDGLPDEASSSTQKATGKQRSKQTKGSDSGETAPKKRKK